MKIKFGRDGQEIGEYPEEAVPALLQSKVLRGSDTYWHNGMTAWSVVAARWKEAKPAPAPRVTERPLEPKVKRSGRVIKVLSSIAMIVGVIVMAASDRMESTGMVGALLLIGGFFGFVVGRFCD